MEKRNADYERIERTLTLSKEKIEGINATDSTDAVILFGDLNYRVNSNVEVAKYLIEQGLINVMLNHDQLGLLLEKGKVMKGFKEGAITFAPTFKLNAGTDTYTLKKSSRVPSYTDRILYKCKDEGTLKQLSYDSNNLLKCSDHRPVFAQFLCKINGKFEGDIMALDNKQETLQRLTSEESAFGKRKRATCNIV